MDRMTAGVVAVPLASLPLNAKALLEDYPEVAAWLSKNGLSLTLTVSMVILPFFFLHSHKWTVQILARDWR
jgi:hypothetical protein